MTWQSDANELALFIVLGLGDTIWSIADKQRTVWHLYAHGNSQTSEQSIGEKCFKKITVYIPFDADLSILFCAKRALELERIAQLPSLFISDPVLLNSGCDFLGSFPATMNWSRVLPLFPLQGRWTCRQTRRWLFNLKNRCLETFSHAEQRHPWLLSILIHYTFPNTLSIFVFHLQPVCELSTCFQMEYWFNWMDSWYLILMSCAKR